MKRKVLASMALCLIIAIAWPVLAQAQQEQEGLVYVVPLEGEIDGALPASIERALSMAASAEAELIILRINTYGGLVAASDDIKTAIQGSSIPVYGYVQKAISGGAYVALACDEIYMQSGATMGAVEPVTIDGERITDEKQISPLDNQLRSLAERRGRDPEIATAMVRREKSIEGVTAAGELLTLTANTAMEVGYAEAIVEDYTDIPALAGISAPEYIEYGESWAVRFARFVSHPMVSGLILAVALGALMLEIFTAGFGVGGAISIIAFTLYFGSNIFIGFADWEYIIVFIVGLILLIVEIFTASFGVLGILGIVAIAFSIILTAETFTAGLVTLALALLFTIIIIVVGFRFLRTSKLWRRFILSDSEDKDKGYVGPKDLTSLVGVEGVAASSLRPSGRVRLDNDQEVDAITDGGYVEVGSKVVVTGFTSGSAVVKKI